MLALAQAKTTDDKHIAFCPTCGRIAPFKQIGTQKWPKRVADKMGTPEVIRVWRCECCCTTLTELDLHF